MGAAHTWRVSLCVCARMRPHWVSHMCAYARVCGAGSDWCGLLLPVTDPCVSTLGLCAATVSFVTRA